LDYLIVAAVAAGLAIAIRQIIVNGRRRKRDVLGMTGEPKKKNKKIKQIP
jgi:hypothetical protein